MPALSTEERTFILSDHMVDKLLQPREYFENFYTCDRPGSMEGLALDDTIKLIQEEARKERNIENGRLKR